MLPWRVVCAVDRNRRRVDGLGGATGSIRWPGQRAGLLGQDVIGPGKLHTEARGIGGTQGIVATGPMNLVLSQGPREGLEVRSDDNIVPLMETRVALRSGVPTLHIGSRSGKSSSTQDEITATIDRMTLRELTLRGSGVHRPRC